MDTPFKQGYNVTQQFGARPDYYKQFNLVGHEGLDVIPLYADRTIYAIEDGEVVRDIDDPIVGKAYGVTVVVLNRTTNRAWWYCHLSENRVTIGQLIKRGDVIGTMGGTGNTQGDHLHLGLRMADANGMALNMTNGYQGFIDPLPVLKQLNAPQDVRKTVTLDFEREYQPLLKAAQDFIELKKIETELRGAIERKDQEIKEKNATIEQLTSRRVDENMAATLDQRLKDIERRDADIATLTETNKNLRREAEDNYNRYQALLMKVANGSPVLSEDEQNIIVDAPPVKVPKSKIQTLLAAVRRFFTAKTYY